MAYELRSYGGRSATHSLRGGPRDLARRPIHAGDPGEAERLYRELAGAGREAFVAAGGADIGTIDLRDTSVELALLQLAATLRAPGSVGGPVQRADGRYVLLYADSVEMDVAPFEGIVVARTKNLIARDREQAALDALYARLRRAAGWSCSTTRSPRCRCPSAGNWRISSDDQRRPWRLSSERR